jgi:ftsJ-like methyltransferase
VENYQVIGLDLKPVELHFLGLFTYVQDISQKEQVRALLQRHQILKFDLIQSDMAPNTIGLKDIDAMRAIDLLEQTYWIYDEFLSDTGVFVIKVFMGPGFEEFVLKLKKRF